MNLEEIGFNYKDNMFTCKILLLLSFLFYVAVCVDQQSKIPSRCSLVKRLEAEFIE
jgi:hypothetical protein